MNQITITAIVNVLAVMVLIGLAIIPFKLFRIVPQAECWCVLRLGKFSRVLNSGLNLVWFPLESIDPKGKIDTREQMIKVKEQQVITKDNVQVSVDGVVFYMITNAPQSVYNVVDLRGSIEMLKLTNLRAVIGSMMLDEVLSHRDEINARLIAAISQESRPWGVRITRVEVKELSVPHDHVRTAMDRQMTAERDKRAAVSEAEGNKQKAILEAEGRRAAAFLDAEGIERTAEANAKAAAMVADAVRTGDEASTNYLIANKYLDALAAFANSPNEKLMILPTEITGIIGSLAGIAEIGKRAFAPPKPKLHAAE